MALYAIDPDGSDLVQLTEGDSASPAWSPDGSRLAFSKLEADGSWQIATIAADGTDLQVLTSGSGVSEAPAWSPDGASIVYDYAPTMPTDDSWHTSLYRMNADGSEPALLGEPDTFDTAPRFSPDGSHVVFVRWAVDDAGDWDTLLVVRDLASGDERILPVGDGADGPDWSADGRWIIYFLNQRWTDAVPRPQIERIAADGSGEPEVLFEGTELQAGFNPEYSPDGEHVVFGCGDAVRDDGMCVADADFTTVATLVDDPKVNENHFSWGVAAP